MTSEESLMHAFLDDELTDEQRTQLLEWLKKSPENARRFAAMALLHDRLRAQFLSQAMISESEIGESPEPVAANADAALERRAEPEQQRTVDRSIMRAASAMSSSGSAGWRAPMVAVTVMSLALAAFLLLWNDGTSSSAVAATVELRRLLSANAVDDLRTYQIVVEETAVPRTGRRRRTPEDDRPPKPPMQGATLWVHGQSQFVLKRFTTDGRPFVTGCDGHVSWAVNPDGPVRVSRDLTRFNRDVPGHESSMPLNHFEEALQQLQATYDLQLLPVQAPETDSEMAADEDATGQASSAEQAPSSRLLVAVKRRGERGPARVEILYEPESGRIFQMRFISMPYGPDRLTLRLTLADNEPIGPDFFSHDFHHSPDRRVEEE